MRIENNFKLVRTTYMRNTKYIYLLDELKRKIWTGEYQKGDYLPSEHALCEQYNVSRSTVRQALDELYRYGYILKQQGKGSMVRATSNKLELLSIKGFSHTVEESVTEILEGPEVIEWPDDFIFEVPYNISPLECIRLMRLRKVAQYPVMIEETFFPQIENFEMGKSLFETLEKKYGIYITDVQQDLRAVKAKPQQAKLLNIQAGDPLLLIYRKYFTNKSDFFIFSSLNCNTSKYFISGHSK